MLIDLSCPVENRGISVRTNSETGENYLLLKLFNISEKTIASIKVDVKAFDENGSLVATLPIELSELSALPKEFFAENKAIALNDIPDAKNFVAEITYALFEDGEIYEPSEENTVDCDEQEASLNDALSLRELAPEAICFAKEYESYWRCVCGRANFIDAENCVRCSRLKETVLKDFSSSSALANAFKAIEEEKAQKAIEEEIKKQEKKKKIIKNIIMAVIAVIAAAILTLAGFFIRNIILNSQAKSALNSGDYLKAYELYSKTNSSKISELTNNVIGNNPSNLLFSNGYLAEDEENLYYITRANYGYPANLIKENKETKEKTILTDAANTCLNIAGDYIYFINIENKPTRMTKDGKTTETLFDAVISQMCVVGNDVFYTRIDYHNPKGLTEEECQTLAAQGQIESFTRLHKYNMTSRKDITVSEEEIYTFYIYGGKIYYLTSMDVEDTWAMSNLKSMDLSGKNVEVVVNAPTNSFFVKDDTLYYISCFYEDARGTEISGMSSLDYSIVALNLKTNEKKSISDSTDFIMDMNVTEDSIIAITYNREAFLNYYSGTTENPATPVSELKIIDISTGNSKHLATVDSSTLNVCGDDVFSIMTTGNMMRVKTDATGFEAIYEDGSSEPNTETTEE